MSHSFDMPEPEVESAAPAGPPGRPRILLVEDNPGDARLIEVLLSEVDAGFEVEWVTRLADGLERLRAAGPPAIDAVLLDLALPDSRGFDTFAAVNDGAPQVPVILLTGLDDEELAVRAVRQGAQDYLTKGGVDGALLARAIHYAIERRKAEEALRRSEESLRLSMEASESGVWDLDVRSGMVTAVACCQALLGYDPIKTRVSLDDFWTSTLHPKDREAAMRHLADTLAGRSPIFEMDHRWHTQEGWAWVHSKGRVVERAAGGEPLRFIMTCTNITARKDAEEAAVENARRFEEQRRIAEALQLNFVHSLPEVKGLDLGVVAQAAYEPELVGGDFSDVFLLHGSSVGVLVGDVAGKGIRAAGLTETVRSTVRAFAMVDSSPAFILRKTNEVLLQRDAPWDFVTAILAVLDTVTGHVTYAIAGHPSPVHLTSTSCRLLDAPPGHPLGAFATDYVDAHALLAPGDYLVLYSDGVIEARRGGAVGDERLIHTVVGLRGSSAEDLAAGVRDAAAAFAGKLSDDLEVLVLRLV